MFCLCAWRITRLYVDFERMAAFYCSHRPHDERSDMYVLDRRAFCRLGVVLIRCCRFWNKTLPDGYGTRRAEKDWEIPTRQPAKSTSLPAQKISLFYHCREVIR